MPAAGSQMPIPGSGRIASTMAAMRARGVKYWPAPAFTSCAYRSNSSS